MLPHNTNIAQKHHQQECIPVGCVPPALVATMISVRGGGKYLPARSHVGGGGGAREYPPQEGILYQRYPPPRGQNVKTLKAVKSYDCSHFPFETEFYYHTRHRALSCVIWIS